jgi:hypothetical protein
MIFSPVRHYGGLAKTIGTKRINAKGGENENWRIS